MLHIEVNGRTVEIETSPDLPLLWVLRDSLGLKGTKYGCGIGVCGICTVLADGRAVRSCMTPVAALEGRAITTIEGLSSDHPLIKAWIAEQVPQCGYCQPGQVMAAAALLAQNPSPGDADIDAALSGVLCRCGTQLRIRRAVHQAVRWAAQGEAGGGQVHPQAAPTPILSLEASQPEQAGPAIQTWAPNPWVRIGRDGSITITIDRSEMGQGVATSLAMLVAEELAVDLDQIRIAFAPADPIYNNRMFDEQTTGGSTSVRAAWTFLRQAGAEVRERLIQAAAETWNVHKSECRADRASVVHPASGRQLAYSELIDRAAAVPVPERVALKRPDEWRILGKPLPRIEVPDMVAGRAVYGMDLRLPGMLYATVLRCPVFGGRAASFDASRARAVSGVCDVVQIDAGIAVVADSFQSALEGRSALSVTWDEGPNAGLDSAAIRRRFEQAAQRAGRVERSNGDAERALKRADRVIEAVYETPYLAHAPMEPMNCAAQVRADGCDIWVGSQAQGGAQETAARLTGLDKSVIKVHSLYLGGGFGRRLEQDFVTEAVQIAKVVAAPVQVCWTREDDMQHDFYRPASYTLLRAALDHRGMPMAWWQRVVGPELALGGIDIPYAIPHVRVEFVKENPGIPTGPWRSVAASQNAFAIECFIDELAAAAGVAPLMLRGGLLAHAPRHRAVLDLAAEKAGWGRAPAGRHQGMALYRSFGSWVAQTAEVSVLDGQLRVHRVVCTVDCGTTINPDTAVSQIEGGIVFGLTAALKGEITISRGRVQQHSFEDYPLLRLAEVPDIEVHILRHGSPGQEPPGGVGEPGVPPIAPAVANAHFAATGRRLHSLPLKV